MIQTAKTYKHVCPLNCASSCTLFSEVVNDSLLHITGNNTHPYTHGKLCAKGFSYKERNYHQDRLKYPLYQKVKGSNKFSYISWEKAYDIIAEQIIQIGKKYDHFLPIAYYKGSGNIGVHHYVVNEFFSKLQATKIVGAPTILNKNENLTNTFQQFREYDTTRMINSSIILIWGANPAVSNIHLIPFLIDAKMRGAKLVVIDPIRTQTADLADLYIQLRPNSDLSLAQLLIKHMIEDKRLDETFVELDREDFYLFTQALKNMKIEKLKQQCDIPEKALQQLIAWLREDKQFSYVLGKGLQKCPQSVDVLNTIRTLVAIHSVDNQNGASIFMKNGGSNLFNNQLYHAKRTIQTREILSLSISKKQPIDMLWITGANPLIQEINPTAFKHWMEEIPFIVTVDHFMTPTAKLSNLVLPTTTFFEEMDLVISPWHQALALNEKAIPAYYECQSEWTIMTNLAKKLQPYCANLYSFPIYSDEEQYLNGQFNDLIAKQYLIKNIDDLRKKGNFIPFVNDKNQEDNQQRNMNFHPIGFTSLNGKGEHLQGMDNENDSAAFSLITPHHPYKLNSQFHYLKLSDEKEANIEINTTIAKELLIKNGEIITIYNDFGSIEIKAVYSHRVPKDVILFYQGWYPDSSVTINDLTPSNQIKGSLEIPFNHTKVYVKKL